MNRDPEGVTAMTVTERWQLVSLAAGWELAAAETAHLPEDLALTQSGAEQYDEGAKVAYRECSAALQSLLGDVPAAPAPAPKVDVVWDHGALQYAVKVIIEGAPTLMTRARYWEQVSADNAAARIRAVLTRGPERPTDRGEDEDCAPRDRPGVPMCGEAPPGNVQGREHTKPIVGGQLEPSDGPATPAPSSPRPTASSTGLRMAPGFTALVGEDGVNRAATLLPQTSDMERPAIRVGGALVFAYWQDDVLRVTVSTDDVSEWVRARGGEGDCAVQVDVEDGTVYERAES